MPAQGRSARHGKLWKNSKSAWAGSAGPQSTVGWCVAVVVVGVLLLVFWCGRARAVWSRHSFKASCRERSKRRGLRAASLARKQRQS